EYGELHGLVAIEDIIEEVIGDFTTQAPAGGETWVRDPDGSVVVDGMAVLPTLNRNLGTHFPLDGPKTLNGLIVEQLGEIPDAGTQVVLAGQRIEILQTQDRAVKVVRLLPPVGGTPAPALQSQGGQASSVAQLLCCWNKTKGSSRAAKRHAICLGAPTACAFRP